MVVRPCVLSIVLALSACSDFRADGEDAKKCEADLKSELGLDGKVGFRAFSGTKGSRLYVTVQLAAPPSGDAASVKAKITALVSREFRAHVDQVSVGY
jgi:hypothetical protein